MSISFQVTLLVIFGMINSLLECLFYIEK